MISNLQKYREYKASGVDWIGEFPSHWELIKLRNVGVFSASGIDKYLKTNEAKVKIINFTDVYANKTMVLDSSFEYMVVTTPESNRVRNLVAKGDLIFLPSSETLEDLGTAALVNEELENTSFSYHVIRFAFRRDIDHSFRKYLTNNDFVLKQFSREGKGTTRKIIGRGIFKNVQVIIPPREEQTSIAQFLDRKTALIDQAIGIKEKQIELLKERRQILIHKAVTRGLNPNVKMKDSGVEWIGEMPEGWEVRRLKYILHERNERSLTGNEPLFMMSQIHGLVVRADFHAKAEVAKTSEGNKIVIKNDLVFNKLKAHLGVFYKSNIDFRGIVSPDYAVYYSNGIIPDLKYLELLFRNPEYLREFICRITGIVEGLMRLYTHDLFDIPVPVPPKKEQMEILKYIDNANKKIDLATSLKENEIDKLREYKATLINSAVTGKIKVS